MRFGSETLGLAVAVLALLIAALTSGLSGDRDGRSPGVSQRRPPPADATPARPRGDPLPPPTAHDPVLQIDLGPKQNSSGTAFAIAPGVWMTARHVADGCRRLGILTGPRSIAPAGAVLVHANADLALFRARVRAEPVAVGGDDLRVGQAAYHFGFPRGEPGAVRSRLLGRGTLRERGRYSTREPVLAWAEIERVPDRDEPLSGISGGPVFDATGRLVGVHVAGSVRRGRSYTSAPRSIRELLAHGGIDATGGEPVAGLGERSFAAVGEQLRRSLVVAKAICMVQ